jgi:small subunit ribosomal protein S8
MNDTIADMLARIQNAIMRKKETVNVINTKINANILAVLKQEEMIENFSEKDREIEVVLKYENKESVISKLEKISKPGQRIYTTHRDLKPVMNGRGISVISTSEGVMTGARAKSKSLGGELICQVW